MNQAQAPHAGGSRSLQSAPRRRDRDTPPARDEAATAALRIIRSDDPARTQLEAAGYTVIARSWGANLDPLDPLTRRRIQAALDAGHGAGIHIRELNTPDASAVEAVETANHADYPQTPATKHDAVTTDAFLGMLATGSRAWGALLDGHLIGVAVTSPKAPDWWDISFASVLAEHRNCGIGLALAATVIRDLTAAGATRISTGGAASNSASRGAALALGAVLEPEWLTYTPRPEGCA